MTEAKPSPQFIEKSMVGSHGHKLMPRYRVTVAWQSSFDGETVKQSVGFNVDLTACENAVTAAITSLGLTIDRPAPAIWPEVELAPVPLMSHTDSLVSPIDYRELVMSRAIAEGPILGLSAALSELRSSPNNRSRLKETCS